MLGKQNIGNDNPQHLLPLRLDSPMNLIGHGVGTNLFSSNSKKGKTLMCFSANASFGAGAILSVIGVATLAKRESPSQTLFAGIPFLFAVQQISEGFLWLSLTNPLYAPLQHPATYIFLLFAEVLWPLWVPLAIYKLEPLESRKKILNWFVGIGLVVSLYLGWCLLNYTVEGKIMEHHIHYHQIFPIALSPYASILYIIATVAPHFVSSIRRMWLFGTTVFISYLITAVFYTNYIVSVWCFFASIISISIFFILHLHNKSELVVPKQAVAE